MQAEAITKNIMPITVKSLIVNWTGDSHDAVAATFNNHPHLQIRNASIQIMEIKPLSWE